MKLIKNNIFRIFLYILGYAAAVLIFISAIITFFRYGLFSDNEDFSKPYEISDTVKDGIRADLAMQQSSAVNKQKSTEMHLADKELDIIDYADIKEQLRKISPAKEDEEFTRIDDLVETETVENLIGPDMNTLLTEYVEGTGSGPNIYNSYDGNVPYNSSKSSNVRFLRMTWSEYIEMVKDSCAKYSYSEYANYDSDYSVTYDVETGETYDEYGNQVGSDYYTYESNESSPEEAEETVVQSVMIVSDYNGVMLKDYLAEKLTDGDYFKIVDGKLYYYSPAQELITYEKYGTAMTSNIASGDYVYFLINDDMLDILYGNAYIEGYTSEELFEDEIISSYIYRSEEEAIYSTFDEETRNIFSRYMHEEYYYAFGSDTAYSLDGEEISGTKIYSGDNDLYSHSLSSSFDDYASILETKSDIFIKYDKESGKLTQWYLNKNGETVPYEYLSDADLSNLLKEIDEDFVLGLDLNGPYSAHVEDAFAYRVAGQLPQPALILCFSALVFLAAIILLTVSEPPRILLVDRAPYLVWLILYGAIIALFGLFLELMVHNDALLVNFVRNIVSIMGIILVIMLVIYLATASLWMTVVRRVKAGKFLDGFIIFKIVRWLYRVIGKAAHRFPGKLRGFVLIIGITLVNAAALIVAGISSCNLLVLILAAALALIGVVVMIYLLKYMTDMETLLNTARRLEAGELDAKVDPDSLHLNAREMGDSLNNLGAGLQKAVDASLRDERTKAELITNVSHDIKTPLTSIISYIDLLKREDIENEKALEYIEVLDKKSERLKQLILDLIEASKTSTGNIELECMKLSFSELLNQCLGEHEEKMDELGLEVVKTFAAEDTLIYADGRRVFRVIDNLLNNVEKYAQPNTRVFIDMKNEYEEVEGAEGTPRNGKVICTIKNTSKEMLNISADELMERFVRGDRSRNTEGSGLGLSIARNLTELQNGTFDISIDGDHFRVEIAFPVVEKTENASESAEPEEIVDEATEEEEATYETADPVNEADTPEDTEA